MILYFLLQVILYHKCEHPAADILILQSLSSQDMYEGYAGLVIRMLLIMAGDVELNPGPPAEELTKGLASLITDAPVSVKPVLSVWATDKVDMVKEWNSNKFTVPVLREAMAWLHNSSVDEVGKQLKRKLDLASALPVAIERLLPDECGGCKIMYTVGRADKPTLQCAGCHQGIHEECLQELLGEGVATLSTLHGSLTWMCQTCTPSYRMMTVMGADGVQSRPVSRRQGSAPSAPTVSAPAPTAAPVDEIADRLAAMHMSQGETANTNFNPTVQEDPTTEQTVSGPHAQGQDCPLFYKGECPSGISGRRGGVCTAVHRKRCTQFLRWGSKGTKGCKGDTCSKLHPLVCPASLDLLCTKQGCDYKVHVSKCKRKTRQPSYIDRPKNNSKKHSDKHKMRAADQRNAGGVHPSTGQAAGGKGGQPREDCSTCSRHAVGTAAGCHTSCCNTASVDQCSCRTNTGTTKQAGGDSGNPPGGLSGQGQTFQNLPQGGFQLPTVQPMLETWMESVRKDMLQKQDLMFQVMRMEMMQARTPMLGRGPFGLLPSF